MSRKLSLFVIPLLLLIGQSNLSKAQSLEFGFMIGASGYNGDLTEKALDLSQTHRAVGILTRYNLSRKLSLKGSVIYGKISGADSLSTNTSQVGRNLSFESDLFEFSGQVEFNFARGKNNYKVKNGGNGVIPYVFTGIAVYKFNPLARLNNQWYELQPLATEGQGTTQHNDRKKYALTQISVPLGIGLKFSASNKVSFGIELGARKTFTDYLDDVSTTYVDTAILHAAHGRESAALSDRSLERADVDVAAGVPGTPRGNAGSKDWYYFAGVSIMFRLSNKGMRCPQF